MGCGHSKANSLTHEENEHFGTDGVAIQSQKAHNESDLPTFSERSETSDGLAKIGGEKWRRVGEGGTSFDGMGSLMGTREDLTGENSGQAARSVKMKLPGMFSKGKKEERIDGEGRSEESRRPGVDKINAGLGGGLLPGGGVLLPSSDSVDTGAGGARLIRSKGRIEVMGFEVANVIVRAINLRQSLLERDIEDLRQEVLASEGIKMLVSDNFNLVWAIAADDKKAELRAVARDVARLGKQCLNPTFHSLHLLFDSMGTADGPRNRLTAAEVDAELKSLEAQAQVTADLYHELSSLESMQQALSRRVKDDETSNILGKEVLVQMKAEVKSQDKMVKMMKKKGLWGQTMDSMVEKLAAIVIFLHEQVLQIFGARVIGAGGLMAPLPVSERERRKLGMCGLALQYANIVNMIDTMVMRPHSVEQHREALFHALPSSVRRRIKRTLLRSHKLELESRDAIRQHMEGILDWLVTMAENTIRYGVDNRLQGHTDLTLLQTLHHVQEDKMEALVLELLVALQHLASREEGSEHRFAYGPVPRVALIAPMPSQYPMPAPIPSLPSSAFPRPSSPAGKEAVALASSHPQLSAWHGDKGQSDSGKEEGEEEEEEEEEEDDELGEEWMLKPRQKPMSPLAPPRAVRPIPGPVLPVASPAEVPASTIEEKAETRAQPPPPPQQQEDIAKDRPEGSGPKGFRSFADEIGSINGDLAASARPPPASRRPRKEASLHDPSKALPPVFEGENVPKDAVGKAGAGGYSVDLLGPPIKARRSFSNMDGPDASLSSMVKSQSFAPTKFGSEGLYFAMKEAAEGKSRSQTFHLGSGLEEKKNYSKSLSRKEIASMMEADDSSLSASARIRPMTPLSVDVDRLEDFDISNLPASPFPRSFTYS